MINIWEIRTEGAAPIHINIGQYSSIYNEEKTIEETYITKIHQYFQPRNSNKEITIIDLSEDEVVSNKRYQSFLLSHSIVEQEHQLAATGIMNKKITRDLKNSLETDGYLNSINVLYEDLLTEINTNELPLVIKPVDYKQFLKQVTFEYDESMAYTNLIIRLEQLLPLLVDEMNEQSNNKTLLIYHYPESGLSPKEQLRFSKLLKELNATVIVFTESPHFMGETLDCLNYFKNSEQKISESFIEEAFWNAPINFEREILREKFIIFLQRYSRMLEIKPVISNYRIADIQAFEVIEFYVCMEFLKYCDYEFELDVNLINSPKVLVDYLRKFL